MQEVGNRIIKSLLLSAALLLSFAALPASAAIRCETQYGGGKVCVSTGNLQVNKQVKECINLKETKGGEKICERNEWRDNLVHVSVDQYFKPGEVVEYRVLVKNVGDAKFDKVVFTDTLPSQLDLVEGNLNQEFSLDVGQEREIFLKGRVKSADQLGGMNTNCEVENKARVESQGQADEDKAKVCVQKAPEQAKALPQAGPEDWYILLGLSFLASTTGFYLLRSSYVRN